MKKYLAAALFAALLLSGVALALTGSGYPVYDGTSPIQDAIAGKIGSDALILPYDPDAAHSYVSDGYIQACFYAFDASEKNYLELYLFVPDTISSGDVLTEQDADAEYTCVGLYEVHEDGSETEYLAGQMDGETYPIGSNYEIRINAVEMSGTTATICGTVSAALVGTNSTEISAIEVEGAAFEFSIDMEQEKIIGGNDDITSIIITTEEVEPEYVKV